MKLLKLMNLSFGLFLLSTLSIHADFFNSQEKAEKKYEEERAYYCKIFTQKALDYEKEMREDELSKITLESYKKRQQIYCSKEAPKKIEKTEKKVQKEPKYVKDISLEDERLCKIFQTKLKNYKKNMREDELAYTTLASYEQRAQIFCSQETLDKKEKEVIKEDQKLCKVFQQGPILCQKINKDANDSIAVTSLNTFKKCEKIFCSSKPLHKKDLETYQEYQRLCQVFNDKLTSYQHNMRNDSFSLATFASYKKRAAYFCSQKKPKEEKQ
ncbi:MAG TPA: hypothetical protein ENK82_00710 [Campylobacterales bacterium]|nr:hypothetical protein [Campylobacterales bacterium]